ncbi:polyphosphate kinase 1 [Halonotius sp. F2-221B]|uniref:polyphosphate kinase 1 n=1 Tax=Halonotius sp. F2-221B TaxID=2731620 RepID=UPI00398AC571
MTDESAPPDDDPTANAADRAATAAAATTGEPTETADAVEADLSADDYYLNRELSELAFQERVLHEAEDDRNPPLERLRFLAYVTKNIDEFFMKRVGGLKQQIEAGVTEPTVDGRTPAEQWSEVLETVRPLFDRQTRAWETEIEPALAEAGVRVRAYENLPAETQASLREDFRETVLPTLTPLTFDPAHPFPFISNLSLSLAVLTRRNDEAEPQFTRIKVPENHSRLIELDSPEDTHEYVLLEDVMEANLDLLLPNVEIIDVSTFRLTRNAEVGRNEEVAEDLIEVIEDVVEKRRFANVVRLEVTDDIPARSLELLTEQLDIDPEEIYYRSGPIDYEDFFALVDIDRPDLKLPEWSPQPHPRLGTDEPRNTAGSATSIFAAIKDDDILVHHPYHSFEDTVQRFLETAASDPDVLAIKVAIYRTASDSKVIQSLIEAAENGKEVAVMVELKARFDEQNNLEWVRRLEEEGIHVAYGSLGLKTHTKTALVVREEADGVHTYSHIGTGNYNSETAKGYVDLGMMTADPEIGHDLVKLFNFFTGPTLDEEFKKLLVAPVTMRSQFTELIRRERALAEAGEGGRIVAKVNGLEDPDIVAELYRAGMAGVDIDLIVRDICRLRPGIEGISETITVHSVVGRFLEHSRIFYFEHGGDPEWYLGSADWMTRNLDNRVEAVTPVTDDRLRGQLQYILETMLSDNRRRWLLQADGSYEQVSPADDEPVRDTQSLLMEQAYRTATQDGDSEADTERFMIERGPGRVGHIIDMRPATDTAGTRWSVRPGRPGTKLCSRGDRQKHDTRVPFSEFAAAHDIERPLFEGAAPDAVCAYCWAAAADRTARPAGSDDTTDPDQ